jgi:hypothetical protein
LERRFEACDIDEKLEEWLWPAVVRTLDSLKAEAPKALPAAEKARWAKDERAKQIAVATQALQDGLRIGACLQVEFAKGELRLKDDATTVLESVFVDKDEATQIIIDWRNYLRENPITETTMASDLAQALRCIRKTANKVIASQIAELDDDLTCIEKEIGAKENELDSMAYKLYGLTPEEIAIIRSGVT